MLFKTQPSHSMSPSAVPASTIFPGLRFKVFLMTKNAFQATSSLGKKGLTCIDSPGINELGLIWVHITTRAYHPSIVLTPAPAMVISKGFLSHPRGDTQNNPG